MSATMQASEPAPQPTGLPETVPALFQHTAARRPDQAALFFKAGERWVPISWSEYGRAGTRLGNALLAEGLHPQDRVALWSANRPARQIAHPALPHARLTTLATYPTLAID